MISAPGEFFLLGLAMGHWEIKASEKNDVKIRSEKSGIGDTVNIGIAFIAPAKKIREVLYHPDLIAARRKHEEEMQAMEGPTTQD